MKFLGTIVLSFAAFGAALAADFIPAMTGGDDSQLVNAGNAGQSWTKENAPDGAPAHKLMWDFNRKKYAECMLQKPIEFKEFDELIIRLKYYSSGKKDLVGCGIRMTDATGEMFQWSVDYPDDKPGWKSVSYRITPSNFNGNWGGNNDKKLDFPVKLVGYGIGFKPEATGLIWFGGMEYHLPLPDADGFAAAMTGYDNSKLGNPGAVGQAWVLDTAPDGTPAHKLTWDFNRKTYGECHLEKAVELEEFSKLELELRYYSDGNRELNGCGMRITDATGETFQWSVTTPDDKPGWKTVKYQLTPSNFGDSWGGNKDRKLDFPVKLVGYGIGFRAGTGGPVWFESLKYRVPAPAERKEGVAGRRLLWSFDDADLWWGGHAVENGVLVSGADKEFNLRERMFSLVEWREPRAVRLETELLSGEAEVIVVFQDERGRERRSTPVRIASGSGFVEIPLPGTPEAAMFRTLLIRNTADGEVKLLLKQAELIASLPLLDSVLPGVETGNPIRILEPGKEFALAVRLTNTAEQENAFSAEFHFRDFFDDGFRIKKELKLNAGEVYSLPVALPNGARQGIWYVDVTLSAPGTENVTLERSFAYMVPAGPTPGMAEGFLYSICTHSERWGTRDRQLETMAAAMAGAKVIRSSPSWPEIQRNGPEKWDFALFDSMVELYAGSGMEIQGGLCFTPNWAVDRSEGRVVDSPNRSFPQLDRWRDYVHAVGKRYKGKIRHWEVWNEPDLWGFAHFGPEDHAKLQTIAYDELKKVDPSIRVMTAGFASPHGKSGDYIYRSLSNSPGKYDLLAIHMHGTFDGYRQGIDGPFFDLRKRLGIENDPWYPNETAMHSTGGNEKLQAESLYTKLIFSRARGAMGYTWYDLRNDGFSKTDAEHNYGMVTNDFYPKAVYPVHAALVNAFRGFEYERELNLGTGNYGFLFRNGDTLALAAWRSGGGSGLFALSTDGGRAEMIDLMGNVSPVEIRGGKLLWSVPDSPGTLKIYGAQKLDAQPMIAMPANLTALKDRLLPVRVVFSNPFVEELTLTANPVIPPQFRYDGGEVKLAIPAGDTREHTFSILPVAELTGGYRFQVNVALAGGQAAKLPFAVNAARRISAKIDGKEPDFQLNQRRQVHVIYDNQPGKPYWTGPEDLSAGVRLGVVDDDFVVAVDVTDDIHLQSATTGEDIWSNDSVQIAFASPATMLGVWEVGAALSGDGKVLQHIWMAPGGQDKVAAQNAMKTNVTRNGTLTRYEIRIPMKEFGLSPQILQEGIRFNLVVNDADDPAIGREGWTNIAPGMAEKKDPSLFPCLVIE